MNNSSLSQIEWIPWYSLGIWWLITGFWVKSAKKKEPLAARAFTLALFGLSLAMLFSRAFENGLLGRRFLGADPRFAWLGIGLTFAGAGIATWARAVLGKNWSAAVEVKRDHELIRSGPYAHIRHPIYTGLLMAVVGTAITIGEFRGLAAIALILVAHTLKAKREEAAMIAEFGEKYSQYRSETGFLFPRWQKH